MNILVRDVILDNAIRDIFMEDGTITEISPRCTRPADRIVNGKDKIALPSLINGHTHAAMTLFRGYADDMPLRNWLEEKIWVLEAKLTPEDVYWGSKLACLEMIKNGITVFNDMYWHWEATARAVCDMGLRGFISAVFIDMFDDRKSDAQIEENIRLFETSRQYAPNTVFTFGPHAIYTVSQKSLEWMRDFSEKERIPIHMHLSETSEEHDFSRERYGLSPSLYLDSLGLLTDRFIGCHGCWLEEQDCTILKKTGAKLVHVPVSNLKLAVGRMFPHGLVEKAGIPYCFGTDGCASNNHLDIFETMKFASLLAKFFSGDPTSAPAQKTFQRATNLAAELFFLGEWTIEVGKQTDIMLIDPVRPELVPNFDVYSNMVYAANGSSVDTVISMGRVLMEGRHVPGEEEIMSRAGTIARDLVAR